MTNEYSNPAYEAEFDFSFSDPEPRRAFVVATTPRSGSSLLAFLCRQAGLGFPLEYFTPVNARIIRRRLSLPQGGIDAYARALVRIRTSSNGLFGFKLHYDDLDLFRSEGGCELPFMAHSQVVLLERKDKIAQAISLVIASQTNRWIDLPGYRMEGAPMPSYDRRAIEIALSGLEFQHARWMSVLTNSRHPVLEMSYESLLANGPDAFRQLCDFLSVPPVVPRFESVEINPQNNEANREWKERFLGGK